MAFSVEGEWTAHQSNGAVMDFDMVQKDAGHFVGSARADSISGTVEGGVVQGDNIFFTVDWTNGQKGRYTAALGPDRRLSGLAFDLANPATQAIWFTPKAF